MTQSQRSRCRTLRVLGFLPSVDLGFRFAAPGRGPQPSISAGVRVFMLSPALRVSESYNYLTCSSTELLCGGVALFRVGNSREVGIEVNQPAANDRRNRGTSHLSSMEWRVPALGSGSIDVESPFIGRIEKCDVGMSVLR